MISSSAAGISRRYGGIHFAQGDLAGRSLGRVIGAHLVERNQSPTQRELFAPGMLLEGMRYIRSQPKMLMILVLVFFAGTFGMNFPIFISTMARVPTAAVRPPSSGTSSRGPPALRAPCGTIFSGSATDRLKNSQIREGGWLEKPISTDKLQALIESELLKRKILAWIEEVQDFGLDPFEQAPADDAPERPSDAFHRRSPRLAPVRGDEQIA